MEGFLLIDKPAKMTSHDVVDRLRRFTGTKTIGHAGTLDPFATGLLLAGVGRTATREMQKLVGLDKEYEAVFVFGSTSDTDDRTGVISPSLMARDIPEAELRAAMAKFVGVTEQIPPAYAAIKIDGQKMYKAARAGKPLEAKPRQVRIDAFDIVGLYDPLFRRVTVRVACGSGTYIRALARDLGAALGTGGYVEELRRTKIGPFGVTDAVLLNKLSFEPWKNFLAPVDKLLAALPTPSSSATLKA